MQVLPGFGHATASFKSFDDVSGFSATGHRAQARLEAASAAYCVRVIAVRVVEHNNTIHSHPAERGKSSRHTLAVSSTCAARHYIDSVYLLLLAISQLAVAHDAQISRPPASPGQAVA
jgi:hypothetical protein